MKISINLLVLYLMCLVFAIGLNLFTFINIVLILHKFDIRNVMRLKWYECRLFLLIINCYFVNGF